MAMAASGCLVLMGNRSAIAKNGFKTNKTKTPFYSQHNNYLFPMVIRAYNTKNSEHFKEFEFKDYMKSKLKQVNQSLDLALSLEHPTKINEAMRYTLLLPGKRFRPILCLASCELVGGDEEQAMPLACALEMIVAMSLMMDDLPCIDNDNIRRGMPAHHKVFGEATTIIAGHSLLSFAFQHIVDRTKNVGAEQIVRVIGELSAATGYDGLLDGELLDILSEGKEVSISELEHIHIQKTSKLIEASTVCGAIIGGGTNEEIERLRRYGRHIGLMSQVVNDILDLTKSSQELGKTAKLDLVSDKATYPKLLGIEGSKKCLDELMIRAIEEISYFGATKASSLYYLANYIANQLN